MTWARSFSGSSLRQVPQLVFGGRAPFWAAVVAFLGFAWNSYRDLEDWRLLRSKNLSEKDFDKLDI